MINAKCVQGHFTGVNITVNDITGNNITCTYINTEVEYSQGVSLVFSISDKCTKQIPTWTWIVVGICVSLVLIALVVAGVCVGRTWHKRSKTLKSLGHGPSVYSGST